MFSTWSGLGAPIREGFQDTNSPSLVECKEEDGFAFQTIGDDKKAMYWMKTLSDYAPISNPDCEINRDNEVIMCPTEFRDKVKEEYETRNDDNNDDNELGTESDSDSDDDDDDSSDEEENQANEEEKNENEVNNNRNNNRNTTEQTNNDDSEEDTNDENNSNNSNSNNSNSNNSTEQTNNEDNDDDSDEDDEETTPTTAGTEPFFGGRIEHFSSNGGAGNKVLSLNLFLKSIMIACLFYILAHPDTKKFILSRVFKNISPQNYLYVAMVLFFVVFYIIGIFL